jgi:hypothetical protein
MKTVSDLQRQLGEAQFEFSHHAFRRAIERNISEQEIREAGANAEIIENYPDDKYAPQRLAAGLYGGWTRVAFSSTLHRVGYDKAHNHL